VKLNWGQVICTEGTVDSVDDDDELKRISVTVPSRYGSTPIRGIQPLLPPYIEVNLQHGDPVRILEFPGGRIYYVALTEARDTDQAVLWAPLKAVILAILDDLDQVHDHVHLPAGTLLDGLGVACTGWTGGPMKPATPPVAPLDGYGSARTDTETDETPKSTYVDLVTEGP